MSVKRLPTLLRAITFVALSSSWLAQTAAGQSLYENYTFTTLAGPQEAAASHDGTNSAARFNFFYGVAVDVGGNVYVADTYNNTIRKTTPAGQVMTLAGLAGSEGTNNGTGCTARFNYPYGVAVDRGGNVYVADTYNHVVRKITPAGITTTLAGLAGTSGTNNGTGSAARFYYPGGVAVDGNTNVYVADTGNNTIRKITPAGVVTTLAGLAGTSGTNNGTGSAARFYYPGGVTVDGNTNVYVADTYNHTIRKITPAGVVTTLVGLAGTSGTNDGTGSTARFYRPFGVTVSGNSNVYVADTYNHTIRKIAPGGGVSTLAGSAGVWGAADGNGNTASFNYPTGAAADSSNNVYVADYNNTVIRRITSTAEVTTLAGKTGGSGSADGKGNLARFCYPAGVAMDRNTNVYVADCVNHVIRKITPAGEVTTLAGLATYTGSADGTGSAARFNYPAGVAVDGNANVYVADNYNHMIRKITLAGEVTTLAGSTNSGSADGIGSAARFYFPVGVAVDSNTNVYVGDTYNHTIRKITPAGEVTTLAGSTNSGSADGPGGAACFYHPKGLALDGGNNIYVADYSNFMIRKITPGGVVTTLAGSATNSGSADGTGSAASFKYPFGVAVDSNTNVYVADTYNYMVRKVTPAGAVTTLAGLAATTGNADGSGREARFAIPEGIAVDAASNLYVADSDNHAIRKGYHSLSDSPGVDLPFGKVGVVRHLDVTNLTTTTWSWRFIRYPAASSAQLSSATASNPTFTPDVADLFVLRFEGTNDSGRVAIGAVSVTADAMSPTLNITSPTPNQRWSNTVFMVAGTASDDFGVSGVWCEINDGDWISASGTTNWNTSVTLTPGTNTVKAYALDASGNVSATNSVRFVFVVTNQLLVVTTGRGTISPNHSNAWLEIGRGYSMTASAAPGFVFTNWTGGTTPPLTILTNGAALQFLMQSNLILQANFVDVTKPTNTITSPTAGQRWSNAVFTVKGTAKDNWAVSNVQYQLNNAGWNPATTTNNWTNWTALVNLSAGTNVVQAYTTDTTGNRSTTNTVSFVFVVTNQLLVSAVGRGTISPNYSNAWLEVGRAYSMTASAATGFAFTNWSGGTALPLALLTNGATLRFIMQTNLMLQATFADVTRPTNTITSPTANQQLSNAVFTVRGTARDNVQVMAVWYQLNGAAWTLALSTNAWTNWTATIGLPSGTNVLRAFAVDAGGNKSLTNSVSFVATNAFKLVLTFASAQPLTTNGLELQLDVSPGLSGRVEVSTNLENWSSLTSFVSTSSTMFIRDATATNYDRRFYRAVAP